MDFKECIGDDEYIEYREIGEHDDPEIILSSGDAQWKCYNPKRLYAYLKRLHDMGVLDEN